MLSPAKNQMKTIDESEDDLLIQADILENSGEYSKALLVYEEALQTMKRHPKLLARNGYCLYMLMRFDEAEARFTESLELKPDAVTTRFFRARCYENIGRLDDALADYYTCAETNPKADIFINIGLLHQFRKDSARARESYDKAILLDPENEIAAKLLDQLIET